MEAFVQHEIGLLLLLQQIPREHPNASALALSRRRLHEAMIVARRHGDSDERRAERALLVDEIERIGQTALGQSFKSLCALVRTIGEQERVVELLERLRGHGLIGGGVEQAQVEVQALLAALRQAALVVEERLRSGPAGEAELLHAVAAALLGSVRKLERLLALLDDFDVHPSALMLRDSVTFLFGGALAERLPGMHIVDALQGRKVTMHVQALGSAHQIELLLERDPLCAEPLKVIVPAGTCISIRQDHTLTFSSFDLPSSNGGSHYAIYKD